MLLSKQRYPPILEGGAPSTWVDPAGSPITIRADSPTTKSERKDKLIVTRAAMSGRREERRRTGALLPQLALAKSSSGALSPQRLFKHVYLHARLIVLAKLVFHILTVTTAQNMTFVICQNVVDSRCPATSRDPWGWLVLTNHSQLGKS